jgi:hypothetical protein
MIGAAQQQPVHRAEEQERRVLAGPALSGQVKQLIAGRHGPAERAVQRRGGEFVRCGEGLPHLFPVQHEPSLVRHGPEPRSMIA